MPNLGGRLSAEEVQQVIAWCNEHWGQEDKCPMHTGRTTWGVSDQLVGINAFGRLPPSRTVPMVALHCEVCGYVAFVSSIKVGITRPEDA